MFVQERTPGLFLSPTTIAIRYNQMTELVLPPELHELIIDIIGDEAIDAVLEYLPYGPKHGALDTLHACSLVCRGWHGLTLRHIYHLVHFDLTNSDNRNLERNAELYQLLVLNPLIGRYIRHVEMHLENSGSPEAVETLCNSISPIETLRIVLQYSQFRLPLVAPLDGLHPIFTHLRDLTLSSSRLPLRILEHLTNIRSLTLQGVHAVDIDDGYTGRWRSSTLEKFVLRDPRCVLNQILAATLEDEHVGLAAFFDRIKYLDMDLDIVDVFRDTSWVALLASWIHLETLIIHWSVRGELQISIRCFSVASDSKKSHLLEVDGSTFLELSKRFPWESFQDLRTLAYHISYDVSPRRRFLTFNEDDPSVLLFSGPSHLPKLQSLHVTYDNHITLLRKEELDMSLNPIYLHNLNRTIQDPFSFPSLQTFRTEVKCSVSVVGSVVLDEETLVQNVMNRLPSVFGVGGRREMFDWIAIIVPTVRVVSWA